jgi:prevent-host-death family protein
MPTQYTTYEAKAKFSEVLRKVRKGQRVIVTHHGQPVAEIGPVEPAAKGLEGRLAALRDTGEVQPATGDFADFKPLARRAGALKRFLDDRG